MNITKVAHELQGDAMS